MTSRPFVPEHGVVSGSPLNPNKPATLREATRLANRKGLRVGELIEFLQTQDPDAPVAAGCGCGPCGWSAPATEAYLASGTAVNVGACVKIGWGDFE